MSTPQQPELRRSGLGQSDPASAKSDVEVTTRAPSGDAGIGPVPEDNEPGHHPDIEQDQPDPDEAAAKLGIRADRD